MNAFRHTSLGFDPNPRGICILCGLEEGSRHHCPVLYPPNEQCSLGHDKQGKRNCPTCKSEYDRKRYAERRAR